jgi:flagellar biosynthesis/type III secretory pathway chaperone
MEKNQGLNQNISERLHGSLQELIGLHRQLYEVVKIENEALTNADSKGTYDAAASKEALIHWIHQAEINRQATTFALCKEEALDSDRPSLRQLILHFQTSKPELSQQLQGDLNALLVLVERIKKQNDLNGGLVNESLKHIQNMKKNIFGETNPQARTYNQMGQRNQGSSNAHGPRLISKEV